MPAAYVLIHLSMAVDFADSLREIRAVQGVERADLVVGPDDCIAVLQADDNSQLMHTIRAIRSVKGVSKTDTRSIAAMVSPGCLQPPAKACSHHLMLSTA